MLQFQLSNVETSIDLSKKLCWVYMHGIAMYNFKHFIFPTIFLLFTATCFIVLCTQDIVSLTVVYSHMFYCLVYTRCGIFNSDSLQIITYLTAKVKMMLLDFSICVYAIIPSKKLILFSRYSNYCIPILPLFFLSATA